MQLPTPILPQEALDLSDSELARAAWGEAEDALAQAGGEYMCKLHLLPPQWRLVWVFRKLEEQVANGGFHQFFTNMGGMMDAHLEQDIENLEHEEFRTLLRQVVATYKSIDYRDQWENRGKSWEYFAAPYKEGRFRDEDVEFGEIKPDLEEVIGQQVRKHADKYL